MLERLSILLMVIVIAVGGFIGYQTMQPPSPPSESNADYPSYQRMLVNLEAMTVAPHPSGSKELDKVRSYLLAQIHDMGLEATVENEKLTIMDVWDSREARHARQSSLKRFINGIERIFVKEPESHLQELPKEEIEKLIEETIRQKAVFNENDEVILKNILVKLDAPDTEQGILFVSHYDTKKSTPGAADDMISVSAMLEALREQSKNTSLKNDLYFLFTDGEEVGAIGAEAFIKSHPELKNSIKLVINFEARGNSGGLLMFQTSNNNYNLMRYFQSASTRPLAFSFTTALYRLMPNDTDLTYFLNAGYSGLNFAVGEGVENYHKPSDSFENLDRGTAYNFLQTALEMAQFSAQEKFQQSSSNQDGVYFPLSSGHLLLMGSSAIYLLSGFTLLATLFWLINRIRIGQVRIRQLAVESGWLLGVMSVMALISFCIVTLLMQIMKLESESNDLVVLLCLSLIFSAGTFAICILRMRRKSLTAALAGLLPLQLLLIIVTTLFLKEISYIFTLPTLAAVGVGIFEQNNIGRLITSTIFGVGIMLLYVPVCWLIYILFMLPLTPVVIALSVIPISFIAAFFGTEYKLPKTNHNKL